MMVLGPASALAAPLTWETVKYDFSASWSGPDFLGYTFLSDSHSYDGSAGSGINEVIGLTGMVTAAWNLNLYSFPSTGVGSNLGAMFSNMGLSYNPPDGASRDFTFKLASELVFTLDRPGYFTTYSWGNTQDIGPFTVQKLESGNLVGNTFTPVSTVLDPVAFPGATLIGAGTYRYSSLIDTAFSQSTPGTIGNNTIFQVIETVPEPTSMVALGVGLIAAARRRRRG